VLIKKLINILSFTNPLNILNRLLLKEDVKTVNSAQVTSDELSEVQVENLILPLVANALYLN